MVFKQFYLGCLAQASYLIGSESEAAIVDPQRDVDQYLAEAAARGLEIKYVIETHLHADFVSGHRELADRTGAEIVFGRKAGATFPHRAVADGDRLQLGRLTLEFKETPGHTPESISILVHDPEHGPGPSKVLTGDTLFIGDVGRPDLVAAAGYTADEMAGMLYDSLHQKLLVLDDAVEVYPAHGAGSMCGRNISKETWSTIGEQRKFNYALQPMSRPDFVRMMTSDLPEAPAYFAKDAAINRAGAQALSNLPRPTPLVPAAFSRAAESGQLVLDVRPGSAFGAGHVPGSLNIGLGGQFASWAGSLIKIGTPILLVAESEAQVDEAVMRLARVGIESAGGYLAGGMAAWDKDRRPVARLPQMPVDELKQQLAEGRPLQVLDVRRPGEYVGGHAPGAQNVPLSALAAELARLDRNRPTAVICQSGYRSSTATSLLAREGFRDLSNVVGGTSAWIQAGFPVEKTDSEPASASR